MPSTQGSRFRLRGAGLPSPVVGLVVGLLFTAWRYPVLRQLPVWDGAMGVSPAAITLEGLDFDWAAMSRMDDYHAGGPKVHAFSAYTLLVAWMVRMCGSYLSALPWLHLLSFGILGLLAAGTHRLSKWAGASDTGALLATALAVLFPPIVVQASDVYLDLPLATATIWAIALALEDRWVSAVVAASIAAAVKPTAVVMLPVLAWLLVQRRPARWGGLGALMVPAGIAVAPLIISATYRTTTSGTGATIRQTTTATLLYLSTMPILALLVLAVTVLHMSGRDHDRAPRARRLSIAALLLVASFLLFFALNPLVSEGFSGLPRYTTIFSPVLAAALVGTSHVRLQGRHRTVPGMVFLVLFVANMYGHLEPPSTNLYPLAERSLAYEKMLAVQRASLIRFEELGRVMPAYYDHFTHYRLTYPETGWSLGPLPDGTAVYITPGGPWSELANMPPEFVMLLEAEWLGGDKLADIKRHAVASEGWSVHTEVFEEGEFRNEVIVVRRTDGGSRSGTQQGTMVAGAPQVPGS